MNWKIFNTNIWKKNISHTVYVPGAICGPAKLGCGRAGSPGITEWGPCLQNTQTHVESVVCAS